VSGALGGVSEVVSRFIEDIFSRASVLRLWTNRWTVIIEGHEKCNCEGLWSHSREREIIKRRVFFFNHDTNLIF
jgi:hypothetical protein